VLDEFAEADAAGVGADGDVELFGEEVDGEDLVDAAEAAGVDLAELKATGLHELFEEDAVLAVLAGSNTDAEGIDGAGDGGVAEDIVGAGGFFDPEWLEAGEGLHVVDGLVNVPPLVGVHHELAVVADLLADDGAAADVVGEVTADLNL